ncbi:LysM domain-containing protein [Alkalihalobacillus sp. LMS39]|uniref:LysM peptidoglycan-binding domain-containing protein n=1 Tax=Alkalihalobacillus sp. LMS39 TaxID=2924032 RepID=UPI001FB532AD|nr:LysM domain-containing protein [Alkalihalobacillus sp. LMS39]UOE92033.1 LysM peptidoglycan-binding domain-containing protein [Alkalihalobacillus sp. LMS39]
MRLYVTKEGESLLAIAKKYSVQVEVLKKVNKHVHNVSHLPADTHITIPAIIGLDDKLTVGGIKESNTKGNVCAYVDDEIVYYKQPNITHWPSQDYTHPHPKIGTHAAEKFGSHFGKTVQ